MRKLDLSVAVGDYDRVRPMVDGDVRIDGASPIFLLLEPEEIFFRALRHSEFDICELSLSSFTVQAATGGGPYVAVPVFPSRAFRHTCFYIRTDRGIDTPGDLAGKRIGIPEYQLTANVWARALLEDEYGVKPSDVTWVRAGINQAGRVEKIALDLPSDIRIEMASDDATLSSMLAAGEIDAVMAPRAPHCYDQRAPDIGRLFKDPVGAASDYFRRTGIFPIMHLLGIRRSLVERHPWLPGAVIKAFGQAKAIAMGRLGDVGASKVTLPFVEERLQDAQTLMGDDFWSYGLEPNRNVLDTFLRHHHRQGLSSRRLAPEDLFHPASLEAHRT